MLGRPGEGIHAWRLCGLAAVDVICTLLACWLISWKGGIAFWKVATCAFSLAILVHRIFCIDTRVNVALFCRVSSLREW